MPVTVDDVLFDPPQEREAHGLWTDHDRPKGGMRRPLPENRWAAELDGYVPTEEDLRYWEGSLAPEAELGPIIRNAELERCGTETCVPMPFLDWLF